jgi:hypothetical protein
MKDRCAGCNEPTAAKTCAYCGEFYCDHCIDDHEDVESIAQVTSERDEDDKERQL